MKEQINPYTDFARQNRFQKSFETLKQESFSEKKVLLAYDQKGELAYEL